MNYRIVLFSILLSCVSYNCSTDQNGSTVDKTTNGYFDVPSYFEEEIKRVKNSKVEKTVKLNDLNQTLVLDSLDFNNEFAPFLSSGINQSSLSGKYTVDTSSQANSIIISYTAKEEKMKVRSLKITKSPNGIERIVINKNSESLIYDSNQELTYRPNKGYTIISKQKVFMFEPTESTIQSIFK